MWACSVIRVMMVSGDVVLHAARRQAGDQTSRTAIPGSVLPSLNKTILKNQSFLMAVREAAEGFVTLSVCWPR